MGPPLQRGLIVLHEEEDRDATDRWIGPHGSREEIELHVFCDASSAAYGAAIYVKVDDGALKPHLVMANARLASVKSVSLPRLELLARLVGAQPLTYVKEQVGLPIRLITC
ncbi:hypothetical protein D918_08836 [Trichuris suis]|nr:hypothetical protein D918_08836 [Trichuris suis]